MPKAIKNLDLLEMNVEKLKTLIIELRKENSTINHDLEKKENLILNYKNELNEYKIKYESLKIAESLQGNNDKTFTKAKLNNMIKEIDKCIVNLSS
tara:strand:- start:103 stop:390 length:288 start_codon:yes stop_codon:yes gene_type:complete